MAIVKKNSNSDLYQTYIAALRRVVEVKSPSNFPKLLVVTGSSAYLQLKSIQAIKKTWQVVSSQIDSQSGGQFDSKVDSQIDSQLDSQLDKGETQSIEASELDATQFQNLWSQVSLFEPDSLYILRRATQQKHLPKWLSAIKTSTMIKSHFVLDCPDKMTADLVKQINRLNGQILQCTEPTDELTFRQIIQALCRRFHIQIEERALGLLIDGVGFDLGKIENVLWILSMQFEGQTRVLDSTNLSDILVALNDDDVFTMFGFLRDRNKARAQLFLEQCMDRNESAIAINGIFAKFTREKIERGSRQVDGLLACAKADRTLKSSRVDHAMTLSTVVDTVMGAK